MIWIIKSILYIITTSIFLFRVLSVNALAIENYQYLPDANGNEIRNILYSEPLGQTYTLGLGSAYTSNNDTSYVTSNRASGSSYSQITRHIIWFDDKDDLFNLKVDKEYMLNLYIGSKTTYNPITSININIISGNVWNAIPLDVSYEKVLNRTNTHGFISEYKYYIKFDTTGINLTNAEIYIGMNFNSTTVSINGLQHGLYRTYDIKEVVSQNNEELIGAVNKVDVSIKNQTDTIKDTDSSQAINTVGGFFQGFTTDTYGLTSVISAPMVLINNLVSQTCTAIPMELIGYEFELPCIDSLIPSAFNPLLTLYRTVTDALIGYWVMINTLALIKEFKDPEKDNISVLEL